ncbi:MAG: hypothetical protein U5K71_11140 [Gracilimonas sp.]|nr:hypothetical protein [Gracilimonas sp.]
MRLLAISLSSLRKVDLNYSDSALLIWKTSEIDMFQKFAIMKRKS